MLSFQNSSFFAVCKDMRTKRTLPDRIVCSFSFVLLSKSIVNSTKCNFCQKISNNLLYDLPFKEIYLLIIVIHCDSFSSSRAGYVLVSLNAQWLTSKLIFCNRFFFGSLFTCCTWKLWENFLHQFKLKSGRKLKCKVQKKN